MKYLVLIFLLCGIARATCSGSGSVWSCTTGTTPAQVNTVLSSASDGATITFDSGSYTWGGTQIQFQSATGATLICASIGGCTVTSTAGRTFNLPTASSTKLYRFSGFVVNLGTGSNQLLWSCPGGGCTNVITQLRIDHNTLNNTNSNSGVTPDILTIGENTAKQYVYGVIDHNTVNCTVSCYFMEWINITATFDPSPPAPPLGTVNNLFFENNTITITTLTNNGTGCIDHWGGSAVVWRYNTSTNCRVISHGVLHGGGPSNFEIYQNTIQMNASAGSETGCFRCLHHQGSNTMIAFSNTLTASGAKDSDPIAFLHYRSASDNGDYCNGSSSGYPDGNRAPSGTWHGYPCFRQPGRDVTGAFKPIYVWNNKWSDTLAKIDLAYDDPWTGTDFSSTQIVVNREYYNAVSANAQSNSSSPFNGTTGMGFGTLANRPTTCTTATEAGAGVGYFATDQGSQGTLYSCSATNTWSTYYTPFTYPHPLVSPAGTAVDSLTPTSLTFANQGVGTSSSPQSISLQNIGTVTMNISSIFISGGSSSSFSQTNTCSSTLAPSSSCTINVTFTPSTTGSLSSNLTVSSDASNSPTIAGLSGTGIIAFSGLNGVTIGGSVTVH